MWSQSILTILSLLYARNWLKNKLFLADFSIFLIFSFVTFTICLHFQMWFIQSEGLAFPFFIFAFFTLVDCFKKLIFKKNQLAFYLVSLLILTRLQFYYFYAIFILLITWYVWQRMPANKLFSHIDLFSSMLLTTLVDHSYHYYKHGFFRGAPYGGIIMMVQTLYLANDHAADYFQNLQQKEKVETLIKKRNLQNLNRDASLVSLLKPSYLHTAYETYSRNYLTFQHLIEDTFNVSVENLDGKSVNIKADSLAMDINKTFLKNETKKNFIFLLWKWIESMGGIPIFLFFSILLLSVFIQLIKEKSDF